ncbi:MAG: hypothetical protein ABSH56_08585 [Bryobacteraceae bacterium]|jgi:hypothetical protein
MAARTACGDPRAKAARHTTRRTLPPCYMSTFLRILTFASFAIAIPLFSPEAITPSILRHGPGYGR